MLTTWNYKENYKYVVLYSPSKWSLEYIYLWVYILMFTFVQYSKWLSNCFCPKTILIFFCVLLKNFKICFLISKREAKSHYQAFCTFFAFRVSSLMQTLLLQVTKRNSCITHFSFNKKPPHPYLILRAKIFKIIISLMKTFQIFRCSALL